MSIREKLQRLYNFMSRSYCSKLGLKIAASVAVFMVVPILVHVFLHEYLSDGKAQLYNLLVNPTLWWVVVMSFVALMMVLSKIVIIPLKTLELHISEIEKGIKKDPIVLVTNDEISYLVRRFNSLHKTVLNEIESRDVHLSVIYEFTNSTAGIFDIPTLMDVFFRTLRTAVEFDTGAYIISSNGVMEGRIYSGVGELGPQESEQVTGRLIAAARSYCHNFDGIGHLGTTIIGNGPAPTLNVPKHFVNLPITCKGGTVGIVSLIYSGEVDPALGSKVFNAMVMHANTVIEKLLSHLSEKGKRLSRILSSMSEGVYLINKHGDTTCVNRKGLELVSGWCSRTMDCARKGFKGCTCPDCEFSRVLDKVRALGPALVDKVHTEEIRDRSGRIIQLSASALEAVGGDDGGFVITAKDVTEERMMQKRVMLSSKFAALGEMAAGVAHEVNNPLQWMMANIELLEGSVAPSGAKRVGQLREGILRIKAIVRDLLIFAREQTTETEAVDINPIIRKVGEMLCHQLKMVNVDLEFDLVQGQALVKCNANMFQQVIINLLQNARDAVEESGKGSVVTIRTGVEEDGNVAVEVIDDGPGIPEAVIDRIFDPFFTTKDVGKGTGLGLSVSRRIIESIGGNISVTSEPSEGTHFMVKLPGLKTPAAKKESGSAKQDFSAIAGRSVIIIDDEEAVLKSLEEALSRFVGSIDAFTDGEKALNAITDNEYDFVLMDIRMPGMNGMELYKRIKAVKPYLAEKVLFFTGDTENESTGAFIKLTGCSCISKPFTRNELLSTMCRYELDMAG